MAEINLEKIKANIAAREAVTELLTYVPDVLLYKKADEERFWQVLAEEIAARIGKVLVDDGPTFRMGEKEAEHFEKDVFPYGAHKGKPVGEVDISYILLLTEGDFTRRLIRYVRSQVFADRQTFNP